MPKTLLLDPTNWDLLVDADGNIAAADEPYRLAQDVSVAVRTFVNDQWYKPSYGIPYFEQILGKKPPLQLIRAQLERIALTVSGVVKAQAGITKFQGRKIEGFVTVTDKSGVSLTIAISTAAARNNTNVPFVEWDGGLTVWDGGLTLWI